MNSQQQVRFTAMVAAALLWTATAHAGPPKDPPTRCAPDAALVGSTCVDTYEASVWRIPDPTGANKKLVKNVKKGRADILDLLDGGATQLGVGSDNYTTCLDRGEGCKDDIYAVSLADVTPAAYVTWFQANLACANSGKRLPSNAEWQMAATGSPDPGSDNGTTDCNTNSGSLLANTGTRSGCVSAFGGYDLVGNLFEWVADWVPRSTGCSGTWNGSGDHQCLAGAETSGEPGALLRGGSYLSGASAGPLAVVGANDPSYSTSTYGFRCAR